MLFFFLSLFVCFFFRSCDEMKFLIESVLVWLEQRSKPPSGRLHPELLYQLKEHAVTRGRSRTDRADISRIRVFRERVLTINFDSKTRKCL